MFFQYDKRKTFGFLSLFLTVLLFSLGETKPSFAALEEVTKTPDPLWVQGKVLCEAGEYKKSLRFLMDLLEHTEEGKMRGHILFWIGKSWEGTGDFDRAQESYVAALRENPGLPELSRVLAVHQGEAIPLWDHAATPKEPLSLAKASKPPYNEYTLVHPPILPAPIMPAGVQASLPPSYEMKRTSHMPQSETAVFSPAPPFSPLTFLKEQPGESQNAENSTLIPPRDQDIFHKYPLPTFDAEISSSSPVLQAGKTFPARPAYFTPPQTFSETPRKGISHSPTEGIPLPRKPAYIPPLPQQNKDSALFPKEGEKPLYAPPDPNEILLSRDSQEDIPFQEGGSKKPLYIPPPPQEETSQQP